MDDYNIIQQKVFHYFHKQKTHLLRISCWYNFSIHRYIYLNHKYQYYIFLNYLQFHNLQQYFLFLKLRELNHNKLN
jgi:hypothetical protein